MKKMFLVCVPILTLAMLAFSQSKMKKSQPTIEKQLFGKLADGSEVHSYTLKNAAGLRATIINFGARVVSLSVPDRNGTFADVVLGYDHIDGYVNDKSFFGAIVGRYGNRIGKGQFKLQGKEYHLTANDGENHLHGGARGFDKVLWSAEPRESTTDPALTLRYVSKDGEEGYPGTVTLNVTYTLTKNNELRVEYEGTTDNVTILNPTHHSYFNLTGSPINTILDHQLQIASDSLTPVDKGLITTGAFISVANTPFDFRKPTTIGLHINDDNEQLKFGKGYDHNWVLRNHDGTLRKAAELYDPKSGRQMTVLTDQPGLQFYSGNFLDGTAKGKNGMAYQRRTGLCLEAQCYPDSPNKAAFPSVVLKPGDVYRQTTIYKFSSRKK